MKKLFYLFLLLILCFSCKKTITTNQSKTPETPINSNFDTTKILTTIAFGSCNKQDLPQPMWSNIIENNPDLWIWLGDNIYGDSEDTSVLNAKYALQKANEGYKNILAAMPVIGIWDDHDYGKNDGDKNFSIKRESKELMLDFLDVPKNAEVRNREGAYHSYTFGKDNQKVKIILLDARYFRDELQSNPVSGGQRYLKNETGDILGAAQWAWLESELTNSDAQINLIGCGIQMVSAEHFFEKWSNFPTARQRLFDLLETTQPNQAILLSGDRHIGEVSKMQLSGLNYPLYDITSSGLTHSYENILQVGEINQHRMQGSLTGQKHFGVMTLDWTKTPVKIKVELKGLDNQIIYSTFL